MYRLIIVSGVTGVVLIRRFSALLAAVILATPLLVHGDEVSPRPFTSVKIYFVGWDLRTRVPLSADDVVRMKRIYFEISDDGLAANFAKWLRMPELRVRDTSEPGNARLVIELVERNGGTITLYADRDYLYSEDSTQSRKIGQEFRNRFDLARLEE